MLDRIKTWLDHEQAVVLPRSPMATAITYAQNQWNALNTYVTQGFLNIDNNASERALKRVALGRKICCLQERTQPPRTTLGSGR